MDTLTNWGSVLSSSFVEIWFQFVNWLPSVLGAILVFLVGILLAQILGKIVAKLAKKIYLDKIAETTGLKKFLEKVGFRLEISQTVGLLIKWFLYIVVLVTTADILGLSQISEFLSAIVLYVPNVVIAIVILLVGILISNFVHTLVKETSLAAKLSSADFLANVAKWAILIFTFMAALIQLRVAQELIEILFMGMVFMVALAGGIAFGLGGKDKAKAVIDQIVKK